MPDATVPPAPVRRAYWARALASPWSPAIVAAAAGLLLLVILGAAIDRGTTFAFDRAILLWARGGDPHGHGIGPAWLPHAAVDVTALGSVTVLTMIVALTAGFLIVRRHWLTLALVLGGTVSGSLSVAAIKLLIGRARPQVTEHLVEVFDPSFPSGHAANSAIVYLTLGSLLIQLVEQRGARAYVIAAAASLAIAIGCSRVYLGVHWPSDVLAGWCFGALWAAAWWRIGAELRRRAAA